jgi:hypothetical protein
MIQSRILFKQGNNMTKLSLVAALAVSTAFAGGDITPVEPSVEALAAVKADCDKATTISGKAQVYYYGTDANGKGDLLKKETSSTAGAVTFDVAHKLFDGVTANFTAVGYVNFGNDFGVNDFEGQPNGAYLNVANLTATFGGTILIAGRQLIDSPMFGSFDWLLAPSSYEAYTLVNSSISNVTLVGTYVTQFRDVNTGNNWIDLTKQGEGDHYAVGAVYGADALNASVWYYNIDIADYTQVYADASYNFGSVNVAAQVASTDYGVAEDSMAYAVKVAAKVANIDLTAAVSIVSDNAAGFVSRDGFYTSSWNTFTSAVSEANEDTLSWKIGASTELAGLNTEVSYAQYGDEGSELDVILGYDITDAINLAVVYTSTDYDVVVDEADADNALEIMATYTF